MNPRKVFPSGQHACAPVSAGAGKPVSGGMWI
jgi:hypothetical protein